MSVPREFLNNVNCGACNKYLSYFPIYIAQDNLPICGRCSELLSENSTYIRDTPYESLAQHLKFPCIYHVEGCLENLFPSDVPNHESSCPFRIIHCPLECMWQGTVTDLQQHFEELHPSSILRNGEFEIDFLHSYESYNLLIYNDELFCFKRKFDYSENVLECSLMCYKAIDPVTKYKYEISVQNGPRTLTVKFLSKNAENFEKENVTEIGVEHIKNKLNDPSIIIGKVEIFIEEKSKPQKTEPQPNSEINFDMLRELECPVCMDYIIPPIYQCVTGHSICGDCKEKVSECPTCKEDIKNTQNFTLEKMAYFLTYPCKFTEYGCDFASKPGKIKQHQKYCLHGPHQCPLNEYENCSWKNSAKEIFPHILAKHHENVLEIDSINVFIDGNYFSIEDSACYILKFSDALFKLHYLYKQNVFYWAMQFIGPPEDAKKYKFEIDVIDNNNNNQRMFLRSFCAPANDKAHSFEIVDNYVFIRLNQIKSLITDIFTYRVRVLM